MSRDIQYRVSRQSYMIRFNAQGLLIRSALSAVKRTLKFTWAYFFNI